jgi:hypothetical protein
MSAVHTGHSLPVALNPERQLFWHPERSYPPATGVRGLAHSKHWNPVRPSLHTGGFLVVAALWKAYIIGPMSADQYKHIWFY